MLLVEVATDDVIFQICNSQTAIRNSHTFSDGDEFHLRRDDALSCVPQLCDRMALAGAKGTTPGTRKFQRQNSLAYGSGASAGIARMDLAEISIVGGLHRTAFIF